MPIEYFTDRDENDLEKNVLVTNVVGTVTDADIVSFMNRLIGDPGYRDGTDGLVFTDEIDAFDVTPRGIELAAQIAVEAEQRFAGSRWAIIASQDSVFGMTRMFELLRDPESHAVRVFRHRDPALDWLEAKPSESSAGADHLSRPFDE